MKKIMMLILALIIIFSARNVLAQDQYKLTLEKQEGIYFSRRGVNYGHDSYPYYLYKFGDILAYCIEPGKHISTYTYVGESDFVDLGFSEELKEKLELIGYYGRDYPGHNNIRYSMATQALIWELTGVDTVTYWTKQNEGGEEIDVSSERNEIMQLVNNHKTLPNLKSNYDGYLNKELIIYDTNQVLDNYEVESNRDNNVYIEDNTLHINPLSIGTYNINLKRKSYDEYNTIIFVGKGDNSSQKLGRLHFNKEINTNLTVDVKGINLLIQKVNENNELLSIKDIKFKIKDLNNNTYICTNSNCIYNTDSNGRIIIGPLNYGEYEVEEVEDQMINGYSWNSEKLHITVDSNIDFKYDDNLHNYIEVYFKNNSVKASLEINKKGEKLVFSNNEVSYEEIDMVNIFFDLYTIDNKLIKTIETDQNGYAKIDNLNIGKYYLSEKYQSNDYLPKDKIYFEIKQDNQYQTNIIYTLDVKNILKKGNLEFSKLDLVTSEGIPDTIIEIYDEYNTLLLTRVTDSNGKVIIDNLPIGKYYIIEKEANSLYMITNEKVFFEIKEDGEIVRASMTNEKIEVPVFKTNTNDGIIANTLFGISFLVGIGGMYYERKKSY